MKKEIKITVSLILSLSCIKIKGQSFKIMDAIISDTSSNFQDPEIDWIGNHYCWADKEGVWIGKIDKKTGDFIPKNGKGTLIDGSPSQRGMQLVKNGPEWALSKKGSVCIYPDSIDATTISIGAAKLVNNNWVAASLPHSNDRIPFFGSYDENYDKDGITCVSYDPVTLNPTGMRLRNSSDTTEIIPVDMQGGRWIKGLYGVSLSQEKKAPYELGYFDVGTKKYTKVQGVNNPIDQSWVMPLPEFNNTYIAWCIEKKIDRDEISIFTKFSNAWKKIDSIQIPTDRKEIFSPEPFWWNGKSYLFLVARARDGQPRSLYDQVWIVGLDPANRLFREVSSRVPMNRTDPEVFYTEREPVIYYTETRTNGIRVIHKCATGLYEESIQYPKSPFREINYSKDYFPGSNDIHGRYLGSTETMTIVKHQGKLFAGMGNWMDYPWKLDNSNEGAQILRKDAFNAPWLVDTSLGYRSMRTEAVVSVWFSKDKNDNLLNPNVNLLVCGAGDISIDRPREMNIWVRDDITGKWQKNTGFTVTRGSTGVRCFAVHTDKVTGKQFLFGGMVEGDIIKAQYNPLNPGKLDIDSARELRGLGRVMAMCVCNNDLYATAGVDIVNGDTIGGLYRRIDGVNPKWELVYTWPYIPSSTGGDETNIMRGITCVPDPKGSKNQVIIGTRAFPGIVEVIEPFNNHLVYTELRITDFFASQWDTPFKGPALSAYNNFVADTLNGEEIWWQSLWVTHPKNADGHPNNGAHFLVRYKNGTYQYGDIFDNKNPVTKGESLRACRTICKSPFKEDSSAIFYFGGYDAAKDTSNNTSWIYKGKIKNLITGFSNNRKTNSMNIYPNPTQNQLSISNLPASFKGSVIIYNSMGQSIQSEQKSGSQFSIQTGHLNPGIYFVQIKTEYGEIISKKFIKE
jgi:hypothetical protein